MIAHENFVSSVTLLDSVAKLCSSIKELEPDEAVEKQLQLRLLDIIHLANVHQGGEYHQNLDRDFVPHQDA